VSRRGHGADTIRKLDDEQVGFLLRHAYWVKASGETDMPPHLQAEFYAMVARGRRATP